LNFNQGDTDKLFKVFTAWYKNLQKGQTAQSEEHVENTNKEKSEKSEKSEKKLESGKQHDTDDWKELTSVLKELSRDNPKLASDISKIVRKKAGNNNSEGEIAKDKEKQHEQEREQHEQQREQHEQERKQH